MPGAIIVEAAAGGNLPRIPVQPARCAGDVAA